MDTFEHLKVAAEGGDIEAMNAVAGIYACGDRGQAVDGDKAVFWYKRASSAGSGKALGSLAYFYLTGTFLPENPTKAVELYEKAIVEDPTCDCFFYDLASCYEKGRGTKPDAERAVRLYRRAASLGSGMARGALRRLGRDPDV